MTCKKCEEIEMNGDPPKYEHTCGLVALYIERGKELAAGVDVEQCDRFIAFMNELYKLDPEWCKQICEKKFNCNNEILHHPTIQAWGPDDNNPQGRAGFVGLMNGFFGAYANGRKKGAGRFATGYDEVTGQFIGFVANKNSV